MSQLHWGDEEGYEESPIVFPDDDTEMNTDSGAQEDTSLPAEDIQYDLRGHDPSEDEWKGLEVPANTRRSSKDGPVEYPEGSLGAFSTPEDYEAHAGNIVPPREERSREPEYDDPILLFPPDEMDEEFYRSTYSRSKADDSARSSDEDGDIDDSVGISFSRYTAETKEGEFFFMPFLDIPDEPEDDDDEEEEEGEEVSFSFRKVDAEQVKKEKEFIFMPFLNTSEETSSEEEDDGDSHSRHRSLKGTIFDEGLYLIPLESEEEEQPAEEEKPAEEDEEDSGIYVVSSVGGSVPTVPKVPSTGEKKTSLKDDRPAPPQGSRKKKKGGASGKKRPSGKRPASAEGKSQDSKQLSETEKQFRAAMSKVSPEIRAAVKNDPIQRAALEQAVRIALVQQAAQEAVEKATGRPVFGGSMAASGGKKRRPPRPPQRQENASRARNVSFSPFTLRTSYDDGGVSEFGVTEETTPTPAPAAATPAPTPAATAPAANAGTPDSNQDPVLALLNGTGQDAAASENAQNARRAAYQSPAAVRAAMRTGLDYDAPPTQAAATATGPKTTVTAAEREMQVKRSGCLIWIIIAFVVFFVGVIGVLVLPNVSKQSEYNKGISLMDRGQYMQAIEIFEGFKPDDTKYYNDCREKISECAYLQASQYHSEGKYYEAYNLLVDKAILNSETEALALSSNYYYAEQRYAEGDWQNAANAYSNLIDDQYEDSQEKYNICQYQIAQEKAEQGNFMQAYQGFITLGNYSDANLRAATMIYEAWNADPISVTENQIADAVSTLRALGSAEAMEVIGKMYIKAEQIAQAGDYTTAYETYYAMGNYSDAPYEAAVALYNIWRQDASYGTLTQREDAMKALRNRVGDETAAEILSSAGFNQVRLLGDWTDGDNTFSLKRTEEDPNRVILTLDVASVNDTRIKMETSDVIFDGNIIFRLTDPTKPDDPNSRRAVIQVSSFDSLVALEPGSFTFYCFLNNREFALNRQ